MNTQSVKAAMTKLSVVGFAAFAMLVATPAISKANNDTKKEKEKVALVSKSQVSVKYAGTNENSVVFRVQFHNPTAQKFNLIIKNHDGDVIYSGQYSDMHFSKTIHLLKEEDEMNPTFIIRTANQDIANSFTVSTATDVQKDVVVTRL
ncbi:hypothetical protein [Filimonas effusa]|uniref:Uncharacterized protein n=1 Tax=Filimonas effusa TaxID=2508721 RepID=A0A4Q1DAU3_9BACT|nr:hypothetical protein [Filimonas effusa]RXK86531.1 hypothetical protein ESB13_06920 [Filimonas effusa]